MFKDLYSPLLSIGGFGLSLVTLGTVVSIVAGVLSIIYTSIKIYDLIKGR